MEIWQSGSQTRFSNPFLSSRCYEARVEAIVEVEAIRNKQNPESDGQIPFEQLALRKCDWLEEPPVSLQSTLQNNFKQSLEQTLEFEIQCIYIYIVNGMRGSEKRVCQFTSGKPQLSMVRLADYYNQDA